MEKAKLSLIIAILLPFLCFTDCRKLEDKPTTKTQRAYRVEVLKKREIQVVDGDTIKYRGRTIRFLGVDAPEKASSFFKKGASQEPWASKATKFIEDAIYDAGTVKLIQARSKDRYDRYLGYILVDDKNLNAELARNGLVYTYYLEKYGDQGIPKYWQQVKDSAQNVTPEFESPENWRKKHRR